MPWLYGEQAVAALRQFTRLKMHLMPYLAAAAEQARCEGIPVLRPMVLEFPDDPAAATLDRQYMLGPDILVAPVMSAGGRVDFYLPSGTWSHLLTGAEVIGGRWLSEVHDLLSLPLYARPGSVVAVGARHDRPDYEWSDGVTLVHHRLQDAPVTVAVPALDPGGSTTTFVVHPGIDRLRLTQRSGPPRTVSLQAGWPMRGV